jgi:hypothetical protein
MLPRTDDLAVGRCGAVSKVPVSDPREKRVNIIALMASGPLLLSAGLLIVVGYAYALTVGLASGFGLGSRSRTSIIEQD